MSGKNIAKGSRAGKSNRHVGIKEIAKACSLSMMTVSRALSGAYGVHPKTRQRVIEQARSMGYIPNRLASNLASRKTATHAIGVIIPEIDYTIFPVSIRGFEQLLSSEGYQLFLCCSYDNPEKEYRDVIAMLERRVDGIIMAPASTEGSRAAVERIIQQHCPLVLIDRKVNDVEVDSVLYNDFQGAYDAVSYMVRCGLRRILCLSGPKEVWTMHERQRGYRQALADAGIQIHESDIRYTRLTPKAGEEVMEQMGDSIRENDAVFCLADMMAVGVIRSFKRRGIRIPEDVALVAFSDIIEAELFAVPMTTVRQEALEVGKIAGKHLLKRIKAQTDPNYEPPATETIVVNTQLIVRDSTPPLID